LIHKTAIVSPKAEIGTNVKIGPYAVVGAGVKIGNDVSIASHVCIEEDTTIGAGTQIFPFAAIGFYPQDLKFNGENSRLVIGRNNIIREYVTMHTGTKNGRMETTIGDGNLFMIGVHIAHDCVIGSNIVMGNNATLGGHVVIGDSVIIGGLAAVHQFVRIGHNAIIGGMSGVERDVIPYGLVKGERAHLCGLNILGLRRTEIARREITALRDAYDVIFFGNNTLEHNINLAKQEFSDMTCVAKVVDFMKQKTVRSFCLPKKASSTSETEEE
jgi:UDP-N-acetylglucosamine acyltransferase